MSAFALETLGAWPVYPGHPCSIALCVLRKYPRIEEAFAPTEHGWPVALGDGDIPGAGGCVHNGLDVIRRVLDHGDPPEQAEAWGVETWRRRTLVGGDHRERYEEGVAEAERIAPMLLEELRRIVEKPRAGAEAGPPPARVEDQPAQDEDTSPEPAVARGRLQAGPHLQDGVDRREHGPDGVAPAALRPIGEGEHVERACGEGEGEEQADGDEAADDGHQPYASRGHTLVIPEGGARG